MRSIHNYIQYRCNPNHKYGRLQGKRCRVSYDGIYTKIDVDVKIGKWKSIFKESAGYVGNDNQYWMGNR